MGLSGMRDVAAEAEGGTGLAPPTKTMSRARTGPWRDASASGGTLPAVARHSRMNGTVRNEGFPKRPGQTVESAAGEMAVGIITAEV